MEKERRVKALGIVALVVAVLGLTIAFAALSQTLTINGSAYLDAAKWGIKFQNITEPEKVGNANTTGTAVIEEDVSINNINVSLSTPGDSVSYGVELVNEGTINAKIEKIDKPELTNEQQRYLSFTVKDDLGSELVEGDILNAGETKHLTIKIEFKKDIEKEDLPTSVSNITLSYKLNFVQTDDKKTTTTPPVVENNCTPYEKKDTYNVGDVIALCNEETGISEDFYVMKDNGNTLTALAKYNLLVGNTAVWNDDFSETTSLTPIQSTTEGYGLQSSKAANLEWNTETGLPTTNTIIGGLSFANPDESRKRYDSCTGYGCYYGYWTDTSGKLLSKYGSGYPVDVYDSNSNLYSHVKNYENVLKEKYASVSVRIPTYNELVSLGCSGNDNSCTSAPAWVYSVNYWTASAFDANYAWDVYSTGDFVNDYFGLDGVLGLRPVITISKSDI